MSGAVTRRTALRGSAAASLSLLAGVASAAVARNSPSTGFGVSAEAAALQAEFEETTNRHRAALKRCDEADAAMVWPSIPEALFWRLNDRTLFAFSLPGRERCTGRRWWGCPDDLEALQARQLAYPNGMPIRDARARREEIVMADVERRAALAAAELAAGVPAAEAEYEEAAGAFFDLIERLMALRTSDAAIMTLKALALVEVARRQGGHEKLIEIAIADDSNPVIGLGASLLRDFIGQIGPAFAEAGAS